MRSILITASLVALSFPALAQTTTSASTQAGAVANAIVYPGAYGGGGGTTTYRGGIENVPSLLGSLAVAPCTTAAQIGGAFMGGGFTASLGSESEGCARRANAAAFHALGRDDIALALLAQDKTVAAAIKTVEDARRAAEAARPLQVAEVQPGFPIPGWCYDLKPAKRAGFVSCR